MDGILRCSRYAFGPNRLHYCGPDANRELFSYIESGARDPGLEKMLAGFNTLYPYLRLIADANNIRDPFDERVVEAYWIGNSLLEAVEKRQLYNHLRYDKRLDQHLGHRSFEAVQDKIRAGAVPHHSFHVFSVWKRIGNAEWEHTLDSIDACRISSGIVKKASGPFVELDRRPIVYREGRLELGELESIKVMRPFEANIELEQLALGDIVTMHWGVVCEKISQVQAQNLEKYTLKHLALANQTM